MTPSALLVACTGGSPPRDPVPADAAHSASAAPAPSASSPPAAVPPAAPDDAGNASDAAVADTPAADAGPAPIVADNKVSPTEGEELGARAKALFDAIVKDDPDRGEAFWFPREPFIPLKDVKDPGKYWVQLHHAYVNDIHKLHKEHKSWDGVEYVGFDGWAKPKWVKPGDEANKIGYYRAFHGRLRYRLKGKDASIDVHTIITWQGRWYVTHLRKFKH